jgi:hypothetical protein
MHVVQERILTKASRPIHASGRLPRHSLTKAGRFMLLDGVDVIL